MRIKPVYCLVRADGKQIFSLAPPGRPDDEALPLFFTDRGMILTLAEVVRARKPGDFSPREIDDLEEIRNFFGWHELCYVQFDQVRMPVAEMIERLSSDVGE